MKFVQFTLFWLLSVALAFSQQIGTVDLTGTEPANASEKEQKQEVPLPGCETPSGIMYDGWIKPPDNQPRTISLEIVKLSSEKLEIGSDVQAEVRLKNLANQDITIPWSTDAGVIEKGTDPDHLAWEQANFRLVLRYKQNRTMFLKGIESLYGTKFVKESQLTIKPGEWITASLNFKVEDEYDQTAFSGIPFGWARLSLKWEQAARVWDCEKCGWNRGFFEYADYYKQEHPELIVRLDTPDSRDKKK